ncbi:MAG: signal peptide peptidase SppA [Planctomycetes bacterium]|nr:signal peptide peptidase SppA [Planctomycetota bacterium]
MSSSDQGSSRPEVVHAQVAGYPPPRRRSRWGLFFVLIVLGSMGLMVMLMFSALVSGVSSSSGEGHVEEHYHSLSKTATQKIAIISVEGAIFSGEGFVKHQIDHALADKNVKGIVIRVDSPGGTVTGSDYIYHHLVKLKQEKKIPFVVSMGGIAASGGYYVSMAVGDEADVIYAEPTCWTGSIGVVIPHYDASGLAKKFDFKEDSIKSHELKAMGSPLKEMTPQEKAIFQSLVDDSFARFKKIVQSGRKRFREHPEELDKVATGQVFTTGQALASGLIDKEGFIEDAIQRVIDLGGLNKDRVKVVKYKEPFHLFSGLFAQSQASLREPSLKLLLDMSTPRGWYIFAWPAATE